MVGFGNVLVLKSNKIVLKKKKKKSKWSLSYFEGTVEFGNHNQAVHPSAITTHTNGFSHINFKTCFSNCQKQRQICKLWFVREVF